MIAAGTALDAHAQAAAIRAGEAAPDEFVRAAIAAIRAEDAGIGAVVHERFDEALDEAGRVDPIAPFAGVPILVKDLMCPVAGLPASNGNRLMREAGVTSARSGVLAERLRRAGFVILGSTATAEFGATITTETAAFGACRNPRSPDRSSGGSSGGSAAAVAAGYVPIAHGNDASGSLRIPAAFCGVLGFKPARGRIDDGSDPASWFGLASQGAIASSVRDLRAVTAVLAGDEPSPAPQVGRGRLRIGVLDSPDVEPAVRDDLLAAVAAIEATGRHDMVRVPAASTPLMDPAFGRHFALLAAAGVAGEISRAQHLVKGDLMAGLDASTAALVSLAERRSALEFSQAHAWMMGFREAVGSWWVREAGIDVLLTPVVTSPPPLLGALSDPVGGGGLVASIMRFTAQLNVTGQPALSVPAPTDGRLPTGVQLIGTSSATEDALFDLAETLVAARRLPGGSGGALPTAVR